PVIERGRRESVRQRKDEAEQANAEDQRQFPALEIKHCVDLTRCRGRAYRKPSIRRQAGVFSSSFAGVAAALSSLAGASLSLIFASFAGSVFARTCAMVERTTRTRTLSARSTRTSSLFTTLATVPMNPPPVTTRSPRRIASSIDRCCLAFCCCG